MRALLVIMTIAVGSVTESCFLGTKTHFCERFGLICGPGQECAANQAVCIAIDGCGNGVVDKGEVCDDGNIVNGEINGAGVFVLDQCSHDCQSNQTCGNGILDPGEDCDHGQLNGMPDDACDTSCHAIDYLCGNGIVDQDENEQCDPGSTDSATCNGANAGSRQCRFAICGDGYTNRSAGEECESDFDCTLPKHCNSCHCT
ncbi:MAG TPA: hypothetical protein VHN14_19490 [Kofleriaceae bacterium]|jgi:hypothetical protein|nr:hypothetical protein [Kofleriaceae bacterium]